MGKTVFVTGGTGMLGVTLVEQILETQEGWVVLVLYRNENTLNTLKLVVAKHSTSSSKVEYVRGDILDLESLRHAIPQQADVVFHMAAATSQWHRDNGFLVKVNVGGTENVVQVCLENGVKKLIYTSSISAYAPEDGAHVTEDSPKLGENHISYYCKTKLRGERVVLKAVREDGLQACILNPCQILGKYDNSSWIQVFHAVMNKQLKALGRGGGCFANCKEVAKAHMAAVEKGRIGENYLLGGPARSFHDLAAEVLKLQGQNYSLRVMPDFVLRATATVTEWYSHYYSQEKPFITPEMVERLTRSYTVDSSKAQLELGYNTVPFEQSVAEEYAWVVDKKV